MAKVFISYSHDDRAYVQRLADFLESCGLSVWFDLDLVPVDLWDDAIEREVTACETFILVMSPAAARSAWVKRERNLAERLGKQLGPLLLKGRPFWTVSERQHEDVRGGTMPSRLFVERLGGRVPPPSVTSHQATPVPLPGARPVSRRALLAAAGGAGAVIAGLSYLVVTGQRDGVTAQPPGSPTTTSTPSTPPSSVPATSSALPTSTTPTGSSTTRPPTPKLVTTQLIQTLVAHTGGVNEVAWSPDSSLLASSSYNGDTRIWSTSSGAEVHRFAGLGGDSLSWSPDGSRLAYCSNNVLVLDPVDGSILREFPGVQGTVLSVAWSPDGTRVAAGGYANIAWVWDAASGDTRRTLTFSDPVGSVAWSPDGTRLAAGCYDNTAKIWNATTWSHLHTLNHGSAVACVAWSKNSQQLACAAWDDTASVWNASTGSRAHRLIGHKSLLSSVAWSPDQQLVATASFDATARVWDVATGVSLATLPAPTDYGVWSVAWSPDGTRIAVGSDPEIRIWRITRS